MRSISLIHQNCDLYSLKGVYLHTSRVTGVVWCVMTDMQLTHDPNTPVSATCQKWPFHDTFAGASVEEREVQGIPHTVAFMLSRAALQEVCTAHKMAQRLWGCCISITNLIKPQFQSSAMETNGPPLPSCVTVLQQWCLSSSYPRQVRETTQVVTLKPRITTTLLKLHWWAWCTATRVIFFPLSILACLYFCSFSRWSQVNCSVTLLLSNFLPKTMSMPGTKMSAFLLNENKQLKFHFVSKLLYCSSNLS